MSHYILDENHQPVKVAIEDWALWVRDFSNSRVDLTQLGDVKISTMFLGLDHSFGGHGPPQLFETMIFNGKLDQQMWRYSTWDEAVAGHAEAVTKAALAYEYEPSVDTTDIPEAGEEWFKKAKLRKTPNEQ